MGRPREGAHGDNKHARDWKMGMGTGVAELHSPVSKSSLAMQPRQMTENGGDSMNDSVDPFHGWSKSDLVLVAMVPPWTQSAAQ